MAKIKSNDLGKASFHSFRMTFISKMNEVNAPKAVTDKITGHAQNEMHNVYSKPNVKTKRKWIAKALGFKVNKNRRNF